VKTLEFLHLPIFGADWTPSLTTPGCKLVYQVRFSFLNAKNGLFSLLTCRDTGARKPLVGMLNKYRLTE